MLYISFLRSLFGGIVMKGEMKAVMKKKPGPGAELVTVPIPKIGPRDILVKVKATSICGTDSHIYEWNAWAQKRIKPPRIMGHEFGGEVVEMGKDVTFVFLGDHVSAETHIVDNKCFQCRTGQAHVCQNMKILGVDTDGCFAEYVAIPEENAWVNDKSLPPEIAAIQEPFGNAVHTVFSEGVEGKTVAIFGLGPIGICAVAICKAAGAAHIFGIGRKNEYRLNLAKKMGADTVIKSNEQDVVKIIKEATGGTGVDVCLEMAGSQESINQSLKVVKPGGRMSALGLPDGDITLNWADDIVFKAVRIYGVTGRRMYGTWYTTAGLLKSGRVNVEPIITHKFKLEEYDKGMQLMREGKCGKVVLYP
jgi:threonine 3-dehydrogenase